MNLWESILLGLVQGVTEILPISSDGHLAILQFLWQIPPEVRVNLTAALHLGTAIAILFAFWSRVKAVLTGIFAPDLTTRQENQRLVKFIIVASLPAAGAGLFLEKPIEHLFTNSNLIGIFFLLNGAILFLTRYAQNRRPALDWLTVILIGLIQTTALLPAISRSGTTISLALLLGISREKAFDFSFLLALPITLGAAIIELLRLNFALLSPGAVIVGILTAGGTGILMIFLLRRLVLSRRFFWFGVYCWLIGFAVLLLLP